MVRSTFAILRLLSLALIALPLWSPSPAQAQWQRCANQDETCRFKGQALVRYGAEGRYTYQVARNRILCDVRDFGSDPAQGVLVTVPPHTGPATLLFDIHNRHTYSDEDIRAGRGFAKYTAVIGILTLKGELLSRGAVQSEFRTARDLYDRVSGGAGPGGVKAVAPLGREEVSVPIPAGVDEVSLLGEVLDATTAAGRETATPGRTVAIISNVRVEYRPAPAPPVKR